MPYLHGSELRWAVNRNPPGVPMLELSRRSEMNEGSEESTPKAFDGSLISAAN